jgi:hypothetical protein
MTAYVKKDSLPLTDEDKSDIKRWLKNMGFKDVNTVVNQLDEKFGGDAYFLMMNAAMRPTPVNKALDGKYRSSANTVKYLLNHEFTQEQIDTISDLTIGKRTAAENSEKASGTVEKTTETPTVTAKKEQAWVLSEVTVMGTGTPKTPDLATVINGVQKQTVSLESQETAVEAENRLKQELEANKKRQEEIKKEQKAIAKEGRALYEKRKKAAANGQSNAEDDKRYQELTSRYTALSTELAGLETSKKTTEKDLKSVSKAADAERKRDKKALKTAQKNQKDTQKAADKANKDVAKAENKQQAARQDFHESAQDYLAQRKLAADTKNSADLAKDNLDKATAAFLTDKNKDGTPKYKTVAEKEKALKAEKAAKEKEAQALVQKIKKDRAKTGIVDENDANRIKALSTQLTALDVNLATAQNIGKLGTEYADLQKKAEKEEKKRVSMISGWRDKLDTYVQAASHTREVEETAKMKNAQADAWKDLREQMSSQRQVADEGVLQTQTNVTDKQTIAGVMERFNTELNKKKEKEAKENTQQPENTQGDAMKNYITQQNQRLGK